MGKYDYMQWESSTHHVGMMCWQMCYVREQKWYTVWKIHVIHYTQNLWALKCISSKIQVVLTWKIIDRSGNNMYMPQSMCKFVTLFYCVTRIRIKANHSFTGFPLWAHKLFVKWIPGDHSLMSFSVIIQVRWKFILLVSTFWESDGYNFSHDTIALQLYHVQKLVKILIMRNGLQQWFNYKWKVVIETCPWVAF